MKNKKFLKVPILVFILISSTLLITNVQAETKPPNHGSIKILVIGPPKALDGAKVEMDWFNKPDDGGSWDYVDKIMPFMGRAGFSGSGGATHKITVIPGQSGYSSPSKNVMFYPAFERILPIIFTIN